MTKNKIELPTIKRITIRHLATYKHKATISAEINQGVFCLAGANGLGKSTFLNALNYALTGIVPDPDRDYTSITDYYKYNKQFTQDYFDGRITESQRDEAEVEVELTVGNYLYTIIRGFLEDDELRTLRIDDISKKKKLGEYDNLPSSEKNDIYKSQLAAHTGLASFEQFVFLQHMVFTFDERRHLLFWDEKALEQVLFIAFGVDLEQAKRADQLRRDSEKADSLARNHQWQAGSLRKKILELQTSRSRITEEDGQSESEDIIDEYQKVQKEVEETRSLHAKTQQDLNDSNKVLAHHSAAYARLRSQYAQEYAGRIKGHSRAANHEMVKDSISLRHCELCGARGDAVASAIVARVNQATCPLCGDEQVASGPTASEDSLRQLQMLDQQILEVRAKMEDASNRIERLSQRLESVTLKMAEAEEALATFEAQNSEAVAAAMANRKPDMLDSVIEDYEKQMQDHLRQKEIRIQIRNEKRRELKKLQTGLERQYDAVEEEFVPIFRKLAKSFLGLDLSVSFEKRATSVQLVLEVTSQARRESFQLSESQRFFIDIALRMSLIQFIASVKQNGCLLLDTPEGSLDIAYESRAGDMLALFVENGFNIIMTANINSSRLILSLAQQCGPSKKMKLCPMTTWAELSEVQMQESKLFEGAFQQIQRTLETGSIT